MESPEKRESSINKVIAHTEEKAREIRAHFAALFEDETPAMYERDKTEEEKAIIRGINTAVQEAVSEYGGSPLNIREDQVVIIDNSKMHLLSPRIKRELMNFPGGVAQFVPEGQVIVVYPGDDQTLGSFPKLRMAEVLAHEMIHFNSYFSVQSVDNEVKFRRGGWVMISKKYGTPFAGLDEAVVSRIEHQISRDRLGAIPELSTEYQEREREIGQLMSIDSREEFYLKPSFITMGEQSYGLGSEVTLSPYPYFKERQRLDKLMKDIKKSMPERFLTTDAVFYEFANALFTGKIIKIAKLIEKARGRGAFRKLGLKTRKPKR